MVKNAPQYLGAADCADWMHHQTGCQVLDLAAEDGWEDSEWDPAIVETLTAEYPKGKEINERLYSFAHWLEEDQRKRFGELVNFLVGRYAKLYPPAPPPGQTLMDIFTPKGEDNGNQNPVGAAQGNESRTG
jgi:hypothetical protein